MSTREATMQALARLAVGDSRGELGRGAALALARVVLEEPESNMTQHRLEGGELELVALGPGGVAGVLERPGRVTASHSSVDDNDEGT